ncbi:MAG: glycosyltransferase family 4 protein [Oscillospiraceae bacterium]|nr:glycosyltransferase family 4 protein [Oscillospiraceae bacterium]
MRTYHIINIITDTNIGGAGTVLCNYLAEADREGFRHTVVIPRDSRLKPRLEAAGIAVIEADGIADESFSFAAVKTLRQLFRREKPDLIHTHGAFSARVAGRLYKKCAVVTTRHCCYPQARYKTVFPGKTLLGAVNNFFADEFIAISVAAEKNLTDTGTNPRKITTMLNGVLPIPEAADAKKAELRSKFGIADGDFVCTLAARLVPEKGQRYVLETAKMLTEYPIKFLFAGTGPDEEALKAAAPENVIVVGFVSDMSAAHSITDVQLNASTGTECSSISLLEGFSLGVPAIVSDFGGNPSHIESGKNGFVVAQRDSAAMKDAILRLYSDRELLLKMRAETKRIYNERFRAGIMAKNIEQVYKHAIACRNKDK